MSQLDEYYLSLEEPQGSCMITLRELILNYDPENITERWYYRSPCFFYRNKMFCYIWCPSKGGMPYMAFYPADRLTHPLLHLGKRTSSKTLTIPTDEDIPAETIYEIISECIELIADR